VGTERAAVRVAALPTAGSVPVRLQRCGDHPCPPTGCHRDDDAELHRSATGAGPAHVAGPVLGFPAGGGGPAPVPVSAPGEASELLADRAAASALAGPAAPDRPLRQVGRTQGVGPGLGPSRPLDPAARAYFEPRFGHDFSQVRVYDGPAAAASASRVQARAYTLGSDIVFGAGQYAPATGAGRRVLAHELAHTIQQARGGVRRLSRQLSAAMCAADCDLPEGSGTATGRYELTIYADKEGSFLGLPLTHKVGHAWVRLTDDTGRYWSYGFWPKEGYDASNIRADVDGCVHSPDGPSGHPPHTATSSRSFALTAAQFTAAKAKAVSTCASAPKYNLFGLQCTEFVRQVLDAAGQAPALGFGLIWESPNALESWIRTRSLTLGVGVSSILGTGGAPATTTAAAQLTYTHEFYSLLGHKLRTHWTSRGELGSRFSTVSTGFGLTATTDRVFLPSAYVFGGGFLGGLAPPGQDKQRFAAGFTAGAGLSYRIDEIATVGVEYNVVKDLVRGDPELQRVMFTAGIRLW
jgi:Domain of unknown function (DUF4157)